MHVAVAGHMTSSLTYSKLCEPIRTETSDIYNSWPQLTRGPQEVNRRLHFNDCSRTQRGQMRLFYYVWVCQLFWTHPLGTMHPMVTNYDLNITFKDCVNHNFVTVYFSKKKKKNQSPGNFGVVTCCNDYALPLSTTCLLMVPVFSSLKQIKKANITWEMGKGHIVFLEQCLWCLKMPHEAWQDQQSFMWPS